MHLTDWFAGQEGLTQREFAERIGVTQGRVAQLLAGEAPSLALAVRIQDETKGKVTPRDWFQWAAE